MDSLEQSEYKNCLIFQSEFVDNIAFNFLDRVLIVHP
jgi:hypothetical protein